MNKQLRRAAVALIMLSTVVVSTSCSSGKPGSDAASTMTPPRAASAAPSESASLPIPSSSTDETPDQLTLAVVPSNNQSTIVATAQPLTDYLTSKLGVPVKTIITQDYSDTVEALGSGRAQIAFLPVLAIEQAVESNSANLILQVVRNGSTTYHTQFMTNDPSTYCTDTPVAGGDNGYLYCNGAAGAKQGPVGLAALQKIIKGSTVGFVEQSSSSGYIFPMLELLKTTGYRINDINPQFTGGPDKAVLAVYDGAVKVAAAFDDARIMVVKDKPDVGHKVVVFALSEEIPNDGIVVAKGMHTDLAAKISQTLLDYVGTGDGKKVVKNLYGITDLAKADPASLAVVKQAADQVIGKQ